MQLYGIDAPEGGNWAKKFVSDLVFGKHVRVVKMDIERPVITTIFCNSE